MLPRWARQHGDVPIEFSAEKASRGCLLPGPGVTSMSESETGGSIHARLFHSTARPGDTQVSFHRPHLPAGLCAEAPVGGASLHLSSLATQGQDSFLGRLRPDREDVC